MTGNVNRNGDLILRAGPDEKIEAENGDLFVVAKKKAGTLVLKKSDGRGEPQHKSYLNPPPLPRAVLSRLYRKNDPAWDVVEEKAGIQSRRALTGSRLEDL
jgi:hypothetical protein